MSSPSLAVCVVVNFILIAARASGIEAKYGDECRTPTDARGQCVPVRSCPPIVRILEGIQDANDIPPSESNRLKQSFCGVFDNVHHVCCPTDEVALNSVALEVLRKVKCGYFEIPRVAYGMVARLFNFPWMALLKYRNSPDAFKCGGTLIHERYVLTAAHCIAGNEDNLHEVRLGEHNITSEQDCQKFGSNEVCAPPVEDVGIESFIVHPGYNQDIHHDIALLRLNRTVEFKPSIRAICLPISPQLMNKTPAEYIVSGWGRTETGDKSDVLKWATLPHRERSVCATAFRVDSLTEGHICAGGEEQRDSCRGDSGGPIAQTGIFERRLRLVQHGVVSVGVRSCGEANLPALYSNVSHYMQWITDVVRL